MEFNIIGWEFGSVECVCVECVYMGMGNMGRVKEKKIRSRGEKQKRSKLWVWVDDGMGKLKGGKRVS